MASLATHQVQSVKQFAYDLSESQLQILNSDIDAAKKQLSILTSESESLSQRLKDLEFNMDELNFEHKELSAQEPERAEDQTQFFNYLSSLETRENEQKARLESQRKLQGELQHQLNRLKHQHRTLQADFGRLSEQADADEEVLKSTRDLAIDLSNQLNERERENDFAAAKCDQLKSELIQASEELKRNGLEGHAQLQQALQSGNAELARLRSETAKLRSELHTEERNSQLKLASKRNELERVRTVSSWKNERGLKVAKLKKLKTALLSERRTKEMAEKRDRKLDERLALLTGAKDGDSEKSKQVIMAEIRDAPTAEKQDVIESDMESEEDFARELHRQLVLAEKSTQEFIKYREDALAALNAELGQCEKRGYIDMLKMELGALQAELARA